MVGRGGGGVNESRMQNYIYMLIDINLVLKVENFDLKIVEKSRFL